MEDQLTQVGRERLQDALESGCFPRTNRPAFKVGYQTGQYTNLELIVEPDEEGMVQVGLRQNLRAEKLLRTFFGL